MHVSSEFINAIICHYGLVSNVNNNFIKELVVEFSLNNNNVKKYIVYKDDKIVCKRLSINNAIEVYNSIVE